MARQDFAEHFHTLGLTESGGAQSRTRTLRSDLSAFVAGAPESRAQGSSFPLRALCDSLTGCGSSSSGSTIATRAKAKPKTNAKAARKRWSVVPLVIEAGAEEGDDTAGEEGDRTPAGEADSPSAQ